jgi:type IV secretion system protein VirB10
VTAGAQAQEELRSVRGERGSALVNAARSVQSRVNSVLAAGLMLLLGAAALSWYYAHALSRQAHARSAGEASSQSRAQGEMPLPALGHIAAPLLAAVPAVSAASPAATPAADVPLPEAATQASDANANDASRGMKTATNLVPDHRLAGAVFTRASDSSAVPAAAAGQGGAGGVPPAGGSEEGAVDARPSASGSDSSLATLLRPRASATVAAQLLPTARLLLPKGAFIDCTLETAIDSTLPGMTTCITAADTFSADGKVVLLERGTKLVGETRGQLQQGQARVFVAWAQARTPTGVIVPLDSPGTDELGRSGLAGDVERHFWQRFGAAMLISIVDGAVQAGVQASNRSGGTVVYAPSSSQDVLTEVLKDTVNIAPTLVKHNGDRIQVLVARDVDFRSVYELRADR